MVTQKMIPPTTQDKKPLYGPKKWLKMEME